MATSLGTNAVVVTRVHCTWVSQDFSSHNILYEAPHDNTNKMACVSSEDSGQPGHPPSFRPRWQYSFVEIDHEILRTVILSHPLIQEGYDHEILCTVILSHRLIQEGQLSVSGERTCTILVNRLED